MQEEKEFSLGLAYTPGTWESHVDFGVGRVAMEVMDKEKRMQERKERCGLRKCLQSQVEKEKPIFTKFVKKDSHKSKQHKLKEEGFQMTVAMTSPVLATAGSY